MKRVVVGMMAVGLSVLAFAGPAFAEPPKFAGGSRSAEVDAIGSTRACVSDYLLKDAYTNNESVKWRAEYSTSKSALDGGSGILASDGEFNEKKPPEGIFLGESFSVFFAEAGIECPSVGAVDGVESAVERVLRDLQPDTVYYGRFVAENQAHESAEAPFEFKTLPVEAPESSYYGEGETSLTQTSWTAGAFIESNGAETKYRFEYAPAEASGEPPGEGSASWAPFTSGEVSGVVSVAEEFAQPVATVTGLVPETMYYMRVEASNTPGGAAKPFPGEGDQFPYRFVTPPARPEIGGGRPEFRNVTSTSVHVSAKLLPDGSETRWHFESAPSELGPWSPVAGASGIVSQAEALAVEASKKNVEVGAHLGGLSPSSSYDLRLAAENAAGESVACKEVSVQLKSFSQGYFVCEPSVDSLEVVGGLHTFGDPVVSTFGVHSVDVSNESLLLLGAVTPESAPVSEEQVVSVVGAPSGGTFTLSFGSATTAAIAFDASAEAVEQALASIPGGGPAVKVEGPLGGPYAVWFNGSGDAGEQPVIEGHGSGLTPSGSVVVAVSQQGGPGYDSHDRFQYVTQKQLEESGWADATETPPVEAGEGTTAKFTSVDVPGLVAGVTYRYRLVASNNSPGEPVVDGVEHTLTVPAPPPVSEPVSCPNQAFRTGPSANLPDCRSYEQVTPHDKEGAHEIFSYGSEYAAGAIPGEDGEHLALMDPPVAWGAGPTAGQSPYFFTRKAGGGWSMTAAAVQPETSLDIFGTQLLSPDLTGVAFESTYNTSPESQSGDVEYKAGPPGGPYATVAAVPAKQAAVGGSSEGWVASSKDFSKLILAVEDRTLAGSATGTKQGTDLYEYAGGELRQVNVDSANHTIGTCGAKVAVGGEVQSNGGYAETSSPHSLSPDGSRIFFEAVPGEECNEPSHLYMRTGNGSEAAQTLDIGAYRFRGANEQDTELLVEARNNGTSEISLYNVESTTFTKLFTVNSDIVDNMQVDEDFNAFYFESGEELAGTGAPAPSPELEPGDSAPTNIYRYDISAKELLFVDRIAGQFGAGPALEPVSPDGRYFYFNAEYVAGVPGGGKGFFRNFENLGQSVAGQTEQVYRYDSAEGLIQCVSCASAFDPEPKSPAVFDVSGGSDSGVQGTPNGDPRDMIASADGDFVFFGTFAELVPSDIDGEVPSTLLSASFSVSSDVYEWRKPGIDGCDHTQGCLALITNGRGGFMNIPLGTDASGRDVFFYTNSKLGPNDNDAAGDIYDARIDGGEPGAPARPVECEADACSTPPSAPSDVSPSSSTFTGPGNQTPPPSATTGTPVKSKQAKPKKKVKGKHAKKKKRAGKKTLKRNRKRGGR